MSETKLRAALTEARDWFESQAKAVSKGCGSSYELHDLRVQRDALDAALAAPAQPVEAPRAPSDAPHAELRKSWREGQRWQTRGDPELEWLDTTPCWYTDQEYRRHPDDFDAAAPAQAGEDPEFPEPAMFDAVDRQGNPVSHGYSASQVLALVDADRAARGAAQPLADEQIDRAISELGLNYLADAHETNRAVLRKLCHYAHNIAAQQGGTA